MAPSCPDYNRTTSGGATGDLNADVMEFVDFKDSPVDHFWSTLSTSTIRHVNASRKGLEKEKAPKEHRS